MKQMCQIKCSESNNKNPLLKRRIIGHKCVIVKRCSRLNENDFLITIRVGLKLRMMLPNQVNCLSEMQIIITEYIINVINSTSVYKHNTNEPCQEPGPLLTCSTS